MIIADEAGRAKWKPYKAGTDPDAGLLDEVATVRRCEGMLLAFDDFIKGIEDFGARIQPLMTSRQHVEAAL